MRRVTLLLSGVPQYVTLRDLSYNLDLLFNTNEIETFKIRDLPNHPHTNKRQIALDFRSGFDAMAAQEKLEGYTYELENGREYTLHAKINKFEEYMCSESTEYEGSRWYGDDWAALAMIPNVSDRDMYRAHARLDAQLGLLEKQKLVLEKEKELLVEKQKLKRKYGSMVSSLYEVPTPWSQTNNNVEKACESDTEMSPAKISRSTSRDRPSCRPPRSRSRELRRRSRSKDSGYVLPQIEWSDERTKTRELRSQSRERQRSSANSRDRRSSSRERRGHRYRDERSRSSGKDRNRRSASRERGVRARSRSKERLSRSRESRSKEHRSRSKERRSRSRERISYRRSRSRDRTRRDARVSRSDWYRRGRRLRSPDRRTNQLAIMPRSPRGKSPSEWSVDYSKAGTSKGNTKQKATTNKQVHIKVEKDANTAQEDKKGNKSDNYTNKKDKARKKINKNNSKKAERTTSRVQALSKDIMILVAIVVDEIMDRDKIRIAASNKLTLMKILEELVQDRLENIAFKKNDDNEVLKKYKMKYPMEADSKIFKQLLDEIPKLEIKVPEATVTVCSESEKVDSRPTQLECTTTNLTPVESTDNGPQIKQEPTEEPIIIIDIDSSEKPVPKRPHFVVVIKILVKKMIAVIRKNKLGGEIKFTDLKHVLRHILRNMLKGQGLLPRKEIIRRFREIYPEENDERFVRNAIKDIKDGKYPGLAGHIVEIEAPENDAPNDVVLIEKKYDVVTILDSDDDNLDIKPINQPAVTTEQHTEKQIAEVINLDCESPQAKPKPNPSQPMPGPRDVHMKTAPANPDQNNPRCTNSSQDIPCSNTVQATHLDIPVEAMKSPTDPAMTALANTSQANIDANRCQVKAAKPLHMPELSSLARAKTGLHSQAQTGSVNLSQPKTDVPNPSQANTGFANLSLALTCQVNASQAKQGPNYPRQAMTGADNPGPAKKCPNNPGPTTTTHVNANQVTAILSNSMTCPISTQAASNKENQKKASLDNTIQNLESFKDSDTVVISSRSGKDACRKRRKRDRKRKRAGKDEETRAKDKNSRVEVSKDKLNINAVEDTDNNLKVTAITIVTSLNELIAKSNANETENVPNEIKKEIEIEEEKLDESSLKLPDGPRVTAITIMTSDAELLSLGQDDPKEVNEIKNENDIFYDAEDNFVNDIERAFNDAYFSNSMQVERVEQNSVTEQFGGVNNSEQLSSVNNSEQFSSKTACVPQASRTVHDEEESIESIVKYVASLY